MLKTFLATTLTLSSSLFAQGIIDEGAEPNDFLGTPTDISCGSRIDGDLSAGDADYYRLIVGTPTLVKAYTSIGRNSIVRADTVLEVRDVLDNVLSADDDGGQGTSSYVGCYISTPGVYFISVRGFAAATAGKYTMDVLCSTSVVPEGAEPNNSPAVSGVPTVGACGAEHHGEITAADEDWIAITHTGGNLVVTTGPGGPDVTSTAIAIEDTVLEVYSAAFLLLGFDDDGGESLYSALTVANAPAGLYYAKVIGFDPAAVGFYSVRVGCGQPASLDGQIGPGLGTQPGCAGPAGVPTLVARSSNTTSTGTRVRMRTGSTFSLDLINLQPVSIVLHILGLTLPPAINLGILGAPGCWSSVSLDLTQVELADVAGTARPALFIPDNAALLGFAVHFQSASLAPGFNPLGIVTSNVISGVIGNIAFQ